MASSKINIDLVLNTKGFRPLGRINGQLGEFEKSLDASNARVLAFAASAGILYKVSQAFGATVKSMVNVEAKLADINVIMNLSTKNLTKMSAGLFNIARSTGQSFDAVAQSMTEFSRQGLGMQESLRRTHDALVLARLAGMDTVDATNSLTAAVNSFGRAGLTTTEIVNKLAKVDAAFAVSSEDLANALKRVGGSAQAAGAERDGYPLFAHGEVAHSSAQVRSRHLPSSLSDRGAFQWGDDRDGQARCGRKTAPGPHRPSGA
jgi:hypothetical protein